MKKIALTLSALLVLVLALALTSCGGKAETTTENTTEAVTTIEQTITTQPVVTTTVPVTTTEAPVTQYPIPEGYALYDNGDIAFLYPEGMTKQEGSPTIIVNTENGNNINVVYEPKTNLYETLNNEQYYNLMKPVTDTMGAILKSPSVEQIKANANGITLTKMSHTLLTNGVSVKQTIFATTVGDKTYSVTVTEMVTDETLVNTVLNSLRHTK